MHCTHTCTLAYYYTVHVHYYAIVYAEATIPVKQRLTIFSSLLVAKNSPISVPTQCSHVLLNCSAQTQSIMLCVCECVYVCVCEHYLVYLCVRVCTHTGWLQFGVWKVSPCSAVPVVIQSLSSGSATQYPGLNACAYHVHVHDVYMYIQ